jgi:putative ABC transport system ATP-binding protein
LFSINGAENMKKTVLKLVNISKEYDGATPFQALRDMSLGIVEGEFVSIIGPSGSGKSTLLHILGCLDKPTHGEMYLDGVNVSVLGDDALADIRRDKIGFVFQAFNLASTLNVFKNVELPLMIRDMGTEERKQIVDELLQLVGLQHKAQSMAPQLSGGEKQRVAIARALANRPSILLADEPTGNLDSKSSKDVMELFSKLWKEQGVTVVLITHEPQVAAYGNRMIYLRDGQIERDLRNKPKKVEGKRLKNKG